MRVVIADDDLLVREGLTHLLEGSGMEVVAQAGDADELLAAVDAHRPDVAVVDIRMPPTHTDEGIAAARAIRAAAPGTAVLVLSHHVEAAYAIELLEEYPERTGYLLKERVSDVAVLLDAIGRVTDGETVVDPTIVNRLLGRRRDPDRLAELSSREREVLSLLAEGMSNQAIAARLFVAERTVEAHVTHIFLKLRLDDSPASHRRVLAVLAFLRG